MIMVVMFHKRSGLTLGRITVTSQRGSCSVRVRVGRVIAVILTRTRFLFVCAGMRDDAWEPALVDLHGGWNDRLD